MHRPLLARSDPNAADHAALILVFWPKYHNIQQLASKLQGFRAVLSLPRTQLPERLVGADRDRPTHHQKYRSGNALRGAPFVTRNARRSARRQYTAQAWTLSLLAWVMSGLVPDATGIDRDPESELAVDPVSRRMIPEDRPVIWADYPEVAELPGSMDLDLKRQLTGTFVSWEGVLCGLIDDGRAIHLAVVPVVDGRPITDPYDPQYNPQPRIVLVKLKDGQVPNMSRHYAGEMIAISGRIGEFATWETLDEGVVLSAPAAMPVESLRPLNRPGAMIDAERIVKRIECKAQAWLTRQRTRYSGAQGAPRLSSPEARPRSGDALRLPHDGLLHDINRLRTELNTLRLHMLGAAGVRQCISRSSDDTLENAKRVLLADHLTALNQRLSPMQRDLLRRAAGLAVGTTGTVLDFNRLLTPHRAEVSVERPFGGVVSMRSVQYVKDDVVVELTVTPVRELRPGDLEPTWRTLEVRITAVTVVFDGRRYPMELFRVLPVTDGEGPA